LKTHGKISPNIHEATSRLDSSPYDIHDDCPKWDRVEPLLKSEHVFWKV